MPCSIVEYGGRREHPMKGCIVFCVVLICAVLSNPGGASSESCRFLLDGCDDPQPPSPRKFTLHHGIDFDGDDIKPWLRGYNLDGCRNTCASDARCQAFTFNRQHNVCILKSGNGMRKAHPDAISGSTTPVSMPTRRLTLVTGVDYPGGDLDQHGQKGISLDQCSALCSNSQFCVGFSFVRSMKWCWLKGQLLSRQINGDVVSGTK
jgi:PAN domain-containing protein